MVPELCLYFIMLYHSVWVHVLFSRISLLSPLRLLSPPPPPPHFPFSSLFLCSDFSPFVSCDFGFNINWFRAAKCHTQNNPVKTWTSRTLLISVHPPVFTLLLFLFHFFSPFAFLSSLLSSFFSLFFPSDTSLLFLSLFSNMRKLPQFVSVVPKISLHMLHIMKETVCVCVCVCVCISHSKPELPQRFLFLPILRRASETVYYHFKFEVNRTSFKWVWQSCTLGKVGKGPDNVSHLAGMMSTGAGGKENVWSYKVQDNRIPENLARAVMI